MKGHLEKCCLMGCDLQDSSDDKKPTVDICTNASLKQSKAKKKPYMFLVATMLFLCCAPGVNSTSRALKNMACYGKGNWLRFPFHLFKSVAKYKTHVPP